MTDDIAHSAATDSGVAERGHLLPLLCSVGASLIVALGQFAYGRAQTGSWTAPVQSDLVYYLQIAAQPYYSGRQYLTDPSVPGGAIFYPWVQYLPAVDLARAMGWGVSSVAMIWIVLAASAMGITLYFLFFHFLRARWVAAGLTATMLADGSEYHPFIHQIRVLLDTLINHNPPELDFMHFRLTNPTIDLPFVFLEILALAQARRNSTRLGIRSAGLIFGFLFYLYFYAWTLIAAALALAFLIDVEGRRVYAKTFAIGALVGSPAILRDIGVRHSLSAEGVARFGLFQPPVWPDLFVPLPKHDLVVVPIALAALLIWMVARRQREMIFLWCVVVGGFVLSASSMVTGVYLHDYHWNWFARPAFEVLLSIAVAKIVLQRVRFTSFVCGAWGAWVVAFAATGVAGSILVVRADPYVTIQLRDYSQYLIQASSQMPDELRHGAIIAGDDAYCEMAVIGQDVTALAGRPLGISMALNDADLYTRYGLNQYLAGVADRDAFRAKVMGELGETEPGERTLRFIKAFDEVLADPGKFVDACGVRYVALRTGPQPPSYLTRCWRVVQNGPYWTVWERARSPEDKSNAEN